MSQPRTNQPKRIPPMVDEVDILNTSNGCILTPAHIAAIKDYFAKEKNRDATKISRNQILETGLGRKITIPYTVMRLSDGKLVAHYVKNRLSNEQETAVKKYFQKNPQITEIDKNSETGKNIGLPYSVRMTRNGNIVAKSLGEGTFGKVEMAQDLDTNDWIIMKTVLLVEDNQDDVFVMKMACQRTGIPHLLRVVTDGVMAVDYLSGTGDFTDRTIHPLPNLLFLDIKMPKRDGHQVLKWIREQPYLKKLPVVMLTGSILTADVAQAYQSGATSYLQKIANPTEFGKVIRVILNYWLELNIASS